MAQRRGGFHTAGTVFELTHRSNGWREAILYNFGTNQEDGDGPVAGLVTDHAGNLYGTTPFGYVGNALTGGAVYKLTRGSNGWSETVLYQFCLLDPYCVDGAEPQAAVILDAAGNLYGTTRGGGAYGVGTVYEVERTATGWQGKVLHSFDNNGKDGYTPGWGALAMDSSGALYGTTVVGGHTSFGGGTVFKLTRLADGRWEETILYNFVSGPTGSGPGAGVVMDKAGNLYGTTVYGGSGCGCGVVYKLAPTAKGRWKYTVLHTFEGADGAQPDANLILDSRGYLYGTTATGGVNGSGVVFELTP